MTIDKWVAIGGFMASAFSATAAFFAVKQTMLQRTILTKPQLILGEFNISVIHKFDGFFDITSKGEHFRFKSSFPIKNVGLGAALNLSYSWEFNYKEKILKSGFTESEEHPATLPPHTFEKVFNCVDDKNSNYIYFILSNNGTTSAYSFQKINTEIEYIIPITQDNRLTDVNIPDLIPLLSINQSNNSLINDNAMPHNVDCGLLTITYEDISGNKISTYFSCKCRLMKYISNGEHGPESTYKFKLHRITKKSRFKTMMKKMFYKVFFPKV